MVAKVSQNWSPKIGDQNLRGTVPVLIERGRHQREMASIGQYNTGTVLITLTHKLHMEMGCEPAIRTRVHNHKTSGTGIVRIR